MDHDHEVPSSPVSLLGRQLAAAIRPEFAAEVILAPVGHPVLGVAACVVPSCPRGVKAGVLCGAHGGRWRRAGQPALTEWVAGADPSIPRYEPFIACRVDGCARGSCGWGLCGGHYQAWIAVGRPELPAWLSGRRAGPSSRVACCMPGCALETEGPRNQLCHGHDSRWGRAGRPPVAQFIANDAIQGEDVFDLRPLPTPLRLELQYGLQCRVDSNRIKTQPRRLAPLLQYLARTGVVSLRQRSLPVWRSDLSEAPEIGWANTAVSFVRHTLECLDDLRLGVGWETEYPRDVWRLRHLGHPTASLGTLRFDRIDPLWLRDLAKRWLRWRLSTGISVTQAGKDVGALNRFATFLAQVEPGLSGAASLDRELLERFLAWLAATRADAKGRGGEIGSLSGFLRALHQHRWAPDLPVTAAFYTEDHPRQPEAAARALSEFVATQLENQAHLARFAEARFRLLTELLQRTGLRVGDARRLGMDCLVRDEQGAAYLRYHNHKMRRDAHVPIDEALAAGIAGQQAAVNARWPAGTCLFPMPTANPDGARPISRTAYAKHLNAWGDGLRHPR